MQITVSRDENVGAAVPTVDGSPRVPRRAEATAEVAVVLRADRYDAGKCRVAVLRFDQVSVLRERMVHRLPSCSLRRGLRIHASRLEDFV